MIKKQRVGPILSAAAVSMLLLAGCTSSTAEKSSPEGTWGSGAEGQPQLELAADGSVSGTDGCNRLTSSWEQGSDETVNFDVVASTLMYCEGVDTWLAQMQTATISGEEMVVFDADGTEIGTLKKGN